MQLSLVICRRVELGGGLLLHGALVERRDYGRAGDRPQGIVLAGPSGAGKTTASQRLELPWRALSDDATLVVRDQAGVYWAHAWPTWSRLLRGGPGGTWDVQHAVPLVSVLFLERARDGPVGPVGSGEATSLLFGSADQISWPMSLAVTEPSAQTQRLQRFENACALAQAVPCYRLHLGLEGPFWEEIEDALVRQDGADGQQPTDTAAAPD